MYASALICLRIGWFFSGEPDAGGGYRLTLSAEHRIGAVAGVYFSAPFGGNESVKPKSGLRLQFVASPAAWTLNKRRGAGANVAELRFGTNRPVGLYFAKVPVSLNERQKLNLKGPDRTLTIAGLAAAAAGAVLLISAAGEDEDDPLNKKQCLLPEGCS
jgi:hypothetical protein